MVPKLLSCLSLMTSTGAISRSLIRKEAIHKDVESAPTCASYTTACPFDRIHASHNKLCGSTCDEVTCCESPRRQLLQERMQSPTASPTEVAILCSADSCRATASAKGYNQFGINDEWPFNGGSNTEYSPGCYVYASAVGQQIVFYGDHGSTAEKMAPLSGDVQRIGGACMQASDCGCLEYTLSGFTGNSWYNGVWGRSGMCGNGKPVYTKGGNRYLNFDSDEDRWEFSDTECQTTLNWYPGVVGQQCPISFESGGTWTCSTAPPTVTTVTTIDCQGDRCTGSNVNVNSDYTVVECVGEDACRDATIERQNNAQHVLILCNGKAACKGNNGIDNWVAGDDWTVSCYGGQDVCVDWGIEETGATKCSGNSCPITLQATTPSPTGAPGASNCSCLEYTLAGFSAGSSWYNGVWGKSGMCDNGKPVYSKGNRYLNFDSGENRWEFSDTECETTSNWYPGVVGQQCPISVESGGSWTCIIQSPTTSPTEPPTQSPTQSITEATYTITAVSESDCPHGTYRIESNYACEMAADFLGFQYMGASTFYRHPRGCTVDLDNKVTHNFVSPPFGQPSTTEKLLCATSHTCATHLCPEGQQHKLDSESLLQPSDSKCCEQKAWGAACLERSLCEAAIGDLKNDSTFMCDCVFNHKGLRDVDKCHEWLKCLHEQRGTVQAWFKKLLEFSTDVPLFSNDTSFVQLSNSSTNSEGACYDPSQQDIFSMDCNCAQELQQQCGAKMDDQDCMKRYACNSSAVCDSWKIGRCPSESSLSLSEVRVRLASNAGSTPTRGAFVEHVENAIRSPLERRAFTKTRTNEDLTALDEAVTRKNGVCR